MCRMNETVGHVSCHSVGCGSFRVVSAGAVRVVVQSVLMHFCFVLRACVLYVSIHYCVLCRSVRRVGFCLVAAPREHLPSWENLNLNSKIANIKYTWMLMFDTKPLKCDIFKIRSSKVWGGEWSLETPKRWSVEFVRSLFASRKLQLPVGTFRACGHTRTPKKPSQ